MSNRILVFKAQWCQPCKNMAPILAEFDPTQVVQYDIDEHRDLVDMYEVRAVPTFVVLNEDGKELDRLVGAQSRTKLESYLGG